VKGLPEIFLIFQKVRRGRGDQHRGLIGPKTMERSAFMPLGRVNRTIGTTKMCREERETWWKFKEHRNGITEIPEEREAYAGGPTREEKQSEKDISWRSTRGTVLTEK